MAIEIREVTIKATVQQETGGAGKPGGAGVNNSVGPNEEMLQTAIEKVLDILKDRNER
jgi:hypothetical protein